MLFKIEDDALYLVFVATEDDLALAEHVLEGVIAFYKEHEWPTTKMEALLKKIQNIPTKPIQ